MPIIFASLVLTLFLVLPAKAVCPLCTVAVAAGVGLSRYLGIDDTVSGIWIGGLTVSLIFWTIDWFNRKKWQFSGYTSVITVFYYLIIAAPLYWYDIIGHPLNKFWGIDKLMLGMIFGTIAFLIGTISYTYVKKRNNDRAHFPFQKIAMPVGMLIIFSLIFYYLTK